jgi:1-deoxy-D-xylulose-5-phosphate synthase
MLERIKFAGRHQAAPPRTSSKTLAEEIRKVIISTCSANGGHLAPSLGAVELTPPSITSSMRPGTNRLGRGPTSLRPQVITGRREAFHSLRKSAASAGIRGARRASTTSFSVGHTAALDLGVGGDRRGPLPQRREIYKIVASSATGP